VNPTGVVFVIATLLFAAGMWLLLPGPGVRRRWAGAALAVAGLGLFASRLPPIADWLVQSVFLVVALVTILAAVATVTLRNPVYCAIWFGLTLLGTAGLFLIQGAQFLAVATVVVYAGAILVMFLFVLMLAQPQGRAPYDRLSTEGMLSAFAGTLIVGMLTMTTTSVLTSQDASAVAATIGPAQVIEAKYRLDQNALTTAGTDVSWQRLITRLAAHGPVTPRVPTSIHQELSTDFFISETIAQNIEPQWDFEY